MCSSNVCVMNERVNHIIYRCTGNSKNIKCNKQLGMSCGSDEDCYSGSCLDHYCSNEKKPSLGKTILTSIPYLLLIVLVLALLAGLIFLIICIWSCFNDD